MGLLTGAGGYGAAPAQQNGPPPFSYQQPTKQVVKNTQTIGNAWNQASAPYAGNLATSNQQLAYLQQMMGLNGGSYANSLSALGIDNAQRNAMLGLDNRYVGQQIGFANQGAGLAHQLLGQDRADLSLQKADYGRNWEFDRWGMHNENIARGAWNTPGRQYQDQNLEEQLTYANAGFANEGNRIGTRGKQVDLNLAEQLAGLQNKLGQNAISGKYGNQSSSNQAQTLALKNAMENLGFDSQIAQTLIDQSTTNSNIASLMAQILAYGTKPGVKSKPGGATPTPTKVIP